MSCLGPYYLPQPPRAWNRVQNQCTYFTGSPPATVRVPLLGITVPFSALAYQTALINKGNVLQYKKNSSNLTKQQRYSQIAKGKWTNRTTTWATQSDKYSNPNTKSLKRVGTENITLDGIPTNLPITCPLSPGYDPAAPVVILNSGNLICNTTENICTGETVTQPANRLFNPTSASDVPGPIQELYWNDRIQTWYPRQNLTMNNSTDKWPYNAKFILPVDGYKPPDTITTIPDQPDLLAAISGDKSVELIWVPPLYDGGTPIIEYIINYDVI